MQFKFEYPLMRAYPWRLTTTFIILLSSLTIGVLLFINIFTVGITTYTTYSTKFMDKRSPSWRDRLQVAKKVNVTTGCQPASLVTGGMYQTPNGAFVYTVMDLYDASQGIAVSNVKYAGANFTTCQVNYATIDVDFAVPTAVWEMNITCRFDTHFEFSAITKSVISMNYNLENNPHMTPRANQAFRLLDLFRRDAYNDLLFSGYSGDLTAMFYLFYLHPNASIEWNRGSFSTGKAIWRGQGRELFPEKISPSSITMTENYVYLWAGLALSDLGMGSQQNVLTTVDAFKEHIIPLNWSWRLQDPYEPETTAFLQGDLKDYDLPLSENKPVGFNAYYLCEYISWKTGISLVVDVFVATSSLFMAFWGVLNLALRFWATRSSEKSKHCICANCENALNQEDGSITSAHDISKEGLYSRVPVSANV